ncbi:MAG: hypothetical protein AB1649_21580, partial [Chloroflexota bacterium]
MDARKRRRSGCAFDGTHNRLSSASGRLSGYVRLYPDLRWLLTGDLCKVTESDEKSCFFIDLIFIRSYILDHKLGLIRSVATTRSNRHGKEKDL